MSEVPDAQTLSSALARNIAALDQRRRAESAAATAEHKLAERITRFTGSMLFVYLHMALFAGWIVVNLGLVPGFAAFDTSFVILALMVSIEAIFLSTFVLISQNRAIEAADRRADLDLHINLLTEHELTKLAILMTAVAEQLGVPQARNADVQEISRDVVPEDVLDVLDARREKSA